MIQIIIVIVIIFLFYMIDYNIDYIIKDKEDLYENFNIDDNLNIDIIIARYNEDLKWTLNKPFNKYKYIVYNKGDNEDFEKTHVKKIISLPNVGKCDHTYLYHVIENYDSLADINVFLPGSIDLLYKKKIAKHLLKEIEEQQNAVFISSNVDDILKMFYRFKLNQYKTKHKKNVSKNNEIILKKSSLRPFGLWFQNIFGNIKVSCTMYYGIFSIHKNDIVQHPVSRYQFIIKDLSDHSNPEVGHYIERSWCAIFHPLKTTTVIKYETV